MIPTRDIQDTVEVKHGDEHDADDCRILFHGIKGVWAEIARSKELKRGEIFLIGSVLISAPRFPVRTAVGHLVGDSSVNLRLEEFFIRR